MLYPAKTLVILDVKMLIIPGWILGPWKKVQIMFYFNWVEDFLLCIRLCISVYPIVLGLEQAQSCVPKRCYEDIFTSYNLRGSGRGERRFSQIAWLDVVNFLRCHQCGENAHALNADLSEWMNGYLAFTYLPWGCCCFLHFSFGKKGGGDDLNQIYSLSFCCWNVVCLKSPDQGAGCLLCTRYSGLTLFSLCFQSCLALKKLD